MKTRYDLHQMVSSFIDAIDTHRWEIAELFEKVFEEMLDEETQDEEDDE